MARYRSRKPAPERACEFDSHPHRSVQIYFINFTLLKRLSLRNKFMDEQILENIPALPAHKYPLWVKLFAGGIILAALYSLILLPEYLVASKKTSAAKLAYQNGDYDYSIQLYQYVLETVPSSKKARIGAAEAIFSNNDKSDDEVGLSLLDGITLDGNNWSRITRVMPVEYQKYFYNVKQ